MRGAADRLAAAAPMMTVAVSIRAQTPFTWRPHVTHTNFFIQRRKVCCRSARTVLCALPLLMGAAFPLTAKAQEAFPSKLVRIIVPFGPGTGPDILARTLGQKLSEKWSQPVVVENRPGANTAIGTKFVAGSAPDGHTLMVTANTLVLNKSLRPTAPYDPVKDLEPISQLAVGRLTLVAHPSLGVKTVKDLLAAAKAKPAWIDYASPASGTPHHLAMELLKQSAGISLTHIPYIDTPGAVKDLVGGTVKVMFLPIHVAMPHVQSGRLMLLASGGKSRTDSTPNVPSVAEASGVKDFDGDIWYGLYAPNNTSAAVVAKINADVNAFLGDAEIKSAFARQGLTTMGGTPQALADLTRDDLAKWTRVVRNANIKVD